MRRLLGLMAGVATHLLFGVTVWHLFWYLKGEIHVTDSHGGGVALNICLALGYGAIHSALLHPKIREPLSNWISPPFYGLFFCVVTCVTLLALITGWSSSGVVMWEATGVVRTIISTAWYSSWAFLFYSLWLAGLGYQTGATPWWNWLQKKPAPPRRFQPRGAFLWMRHPVYLSFLGLVWFAPVMTIDRIELIACWTAYVLVGSWLKDQRLLHYVGEPYRIYQSQVAGYPGIMWGPLARRKLECSAAMQSSPVPALRLTPIRAEMATNDADATLRIEDNESATLTHDAVREAR